MKIKLIVVGAVKEAFYRNKIEQYQKKIAKKNPIEIICLKDESIPKQLSDTVSKKIKDTEGEKILAQISNADYVAALCIDGKKMDNEKIAACMERGIAQGKQNVTFVIGGSLGLSEGVIKRADDKISFSDMTFPHQLMRVMLLEVLEQVTCDR